MSIASEAYVKGLISDYEGIMDFTVPKGTIKNFDFIIPYTKYISGVQPILNNHVFRDRISFQIVLDVVSNNVVVINDYIQTEFGEGWYVDPGKSGQNLLIPDNMFSKIEPSSIINGSGYQNARIRIVYQSVGTFNDVDVLINMVFYK